MSRLWKHPSSGVYWLRKGVPDDLRALVGKREEKCSLQTRDPVEAKFRHAKMLLELETRWANLRAGSRAFTEREAQELVAPTYDWWLSQHREHPSEHTFFLNVFTGFEEGWPGANTAPGIRRGCRKISASTIMSSGTLSPCAEFHRHKPLGDAIVGELEVVVSSVLYSAAVIGHERYCGITAVSTHIRARCCKSC